MAQAGPSLDDRFRGCLLGLAVGNALGGLFEAQDAPAIRARCPTVEALLGHPAASIRGPRAHGPHSGPYDRSR